MARPGFFQPFLIEDQQRFVESIEGVDRGGVMIGSLGPLPLVAHNQVEVHEPALYLGLSIPNLFQGALVEADRGNAGSAGEAFL